MYFYIDIDIEQLPLLPERGIPADYFRANTHPPDAVRKIDNFNNRPVIYLRSGEKLKDAYTSRDDDHRNQGFTIAFDDSDPNIGPDYIPSWYGVLQNIILRVRASASYGPDQGIKLTEQKAHGSARARVRSVAHGNGTAHSVIITGSGTNSFVDARRLHAILLSGE